MHSYTTEETGKNRIIFYLAIISSVLASAVSASIKPLLQNISATLQIPEIAAYSVSGAVVFTVLWWLCVKIFWKVPLIKSLFHTPCLSGTWNCTGKGKKYNSNEVNDWNSDIVIEQDLEKISVFQRNKDGISTSSSISATIRKINSNVFELSYLYRNIPQEQDTTLHEHTGVATLIFNLKEKTATGSYYTDLNRQTYGEMKLKKL